MKRSTILLITLLVLVIVAPIIYLSVVISKLPSLKDWVVETVENLDSEHENLYEYKMIVTSSQTLPHGYMYVTTYRGKVDSLQSVNFVAPAEGVQTQLQGDSIIINLDNVKNMQDGLVLTVELPEKNNLKIDNQVSSLDIRFSNVEIGAVNATSQGNIIIEDSDLGALMSVECDATKTISIVDSNIGVTRIHGAGTCLSIADSNVGAMSITGVCDSIALADSNFGVVSWNNQCNSIAQVKDCVMTVKVKDDNSDDDANAVVYMIGEDGERVDVTSGSIRVEGEDGEKVDISPAGVHVNSEDGEKVDISPAGIYVDDEGTSVQITPTGMVVKENGEEVVNIGMDGIKVK